MHDRRYILSALSRNAGRALDRTVQPASHLEIGRVVGLGLWHCKPWQGDAGGVALLGEQGDGFDIMPLTDRATPDIPALLVRVQHAAALSASISAARRRFPTTAIVAIAPDALAMPDALAKDVVDALLAGADDVFSASMAAQEAVARLGAIVRRRGLAGQSNATPAPAPRRGRPVLVG